VAFFVKRAPGAGGGMGDWRFEFVGADETLEDSVLKLDPVRTFAPPKASNGPYRSVNSMLMCNARKQEHYQANPSQKPVEGKGFRHAWYPC
jgi:hypothetical protein